MLTGPTLKRSRLAAGLTQTQLARKLGTTQAYVSLLESGTRKPSSNVCRRLVRVLGLPLTALPQERDRTRPGDSAWATRALSRLGYPGYSHAKKSRRPVNPSEVLLRVLTATPAEPRLVEAMPWLLLNYDGFGDDLVDSAWRQRVPNRLGFVVSLAKSVAQQNESYSRRLHELEQLESRLEDLRLAREDSLGPAPRSERLRSWLRANRPPNAEHWNVLTTLSPHDLAYA